MTEWCWIGLGLMCLMVGGAVVLLALVVWFVAWLIKPGRRTRQPAATPSASPADQCLPLVPEREDVRTVQQDPIMAEPREEATPTEEGAAPSAPFTTYENPRLGRITIHRRGCWTIEKKGGGRRHDASHYAGHESYDAARAYADGTGLSVRDCGTCRPSGTHT